MLVAPKTLPKEQKKQRVGINDGVSRTLRVLILVRTNVLFVDKAFITMLLKGRPHTVSPSRTVWRVDSTPPSTVSSNASRSEQPLYSE